MRNKKMAVALILAVVLICAQLISCEDSKRVAEPKSRSYYDYFDTVSVIYDYTGGTQADFDAICEEIDGLLERYHRLFDIYNEYAGIINLATVNRLAGGEALKVEPEIIEALEFSVEMYEKTDGRVNVAMGAVLSLWHDLRKEGKRIPTDEELRAAGEHISIKSLEINKENGTVRLSDPLSSLDLGAIAKGYAAEKISDMLKERGLSGYAISLGGNVRAVGTKPSGDGWVSGIKMPYDISGEYIRTFEIKDSSLVTSGSYERFYTVDGVNYHHIIDPVSLFPKNDYLSLTVYTENSAVADALSTALFNMSASEIEKTLENFKNTEITILSPSGEITVLGKR